MKIRLKSTVLFCVPLIVFVCAGAQAHAQEQERKGIGHALLSEKDTIEPFLEFFSMGALRPYASAAKFRVTPEVSEQWPTIRSGLEKVQAQSTNKRAADARLLLACGTWLVEKNDRRAIELADSIGKDFPKAESILLFEPYASICPVKLDHRFFAYLSTLYAEEPSERGVAGRRGQEALVEHILTHPMRCADLARLFVYSISGAVQKTTAGEEVLEGVLASCSTEEIRRHIEADKQSAIPGEWPTSEILLRPEAVAALFLLDHYKATGNKDKLAGRGVEVVNLVSSDGWYWPVNRRLGDCLLDFESGQNRSLAEHQYRLALAGSLEHAKQQAAWARATKHELPRERWEKTIVDLKKRVQKAGGKISVDTKEIEELYTPNASAREESPVEIIRGRVEDVHRKQGELSTSGGRQAAVAQIVEEVRQKRTSDAGEQSLTQQEKASVAVGIVHLASEESDRETRRFMLEKMGDISGVAPTGKSDRSVSQTDRQKVDRLIKQMSGEIGIDGAAPDPQTELADMSAPALLYASERVEQAGLPLQARQTITKALANSENPALFQFFVNLVQRAEDGKLTRFAVRGLERILQNTQGGDQGH